MTKISYDPEVKILSIRFSKKQSVESELLGNVVLDSDAEGHLININAMDVHWADFKQDGLFEP